MQLSYLFKPNHMLINFFFSAICQIILKGAWFDIATTFFPELALAIVVIVVFHYFAKFIQKVSQPMLHKVSNNAALSKTLAQVLFIGVQLVSVFIVINIF